MPHSKLPCKIPVHFLIVADPLPIRWIHVFQTPELHTREEMSTNRKWS